MPRRDAALAVSGAVPEEPVVSKKSGHLYEKRLILKVLKVRRAVATPLSTPGGGRRPWTSTAATPLARTTQNSARAAGHVPHVGYS